MPTIDGIKALYAGRGMTTWETREEAEASWRVSSVMDLIERTEFQFWRDDASLQDVLEKDL